ncbi:hypothetical protein [Mycobacterium sp. NPDC004974]
MQLAARSYLAAGVALVGASAIAVSPTAPPVPQVHMPYALTAAIDNPVTVFEPVATATQTLINNIIERQTTNPAPIPRQLVDNAVAGYQAFMTTPPVWLIAQTLADIVVNAQEFGPNLAALGETSAAAVTALGKALGDLAAGLPAALQAAGAQFAAGNPSGAIDALVLPGMQPVVDIFLNAMSPEINAIGHVFNVPQPLIDAAANASLGVIIGLASATVGIGFDIPGQPLPLVKQVLVGAQNVINAAVSGDPINVVNAVQHGISDLATSMVFQIDATISMGNYIEDSFVDALKQIKPKPFTPPTDVITAKALAAPAPATVEVSTLQAEKPASAPVSNADNASGTEADSAAAPAADASNASDASDAGADTKPVTKLTKASPKAAKGQAKENSANAVRSQVKSAVKKLTDGLKKDKTGPQKGAEKKAESSNDSAKGSDKG